jgi:Ca2+-binding RTX toxin-like protein
LDGGSGDDLLSGASGDDTLIGGAGADALDGDAGSDTASYAGASAGVLANLANSALNSGDAAGDTYTGIENLLGSAQADTLTGDGGVNRIDGNNGDDILAGGGGADVLIGGAGVDTADYSNSASGVNISTSGAAGVGGDAAGDTLSGIERIAGSAFADTLTGDGGANLLNGNDGDDLLEGGLGADTLIGGTGFDTVDYSSSAAAVSVFLTGIGGTGGLAAGDVLSSIERVLGSSFGDAMVGDAAANWLVGNSSCEQRRRGRG